MHLQTQHEAPVESKSCKLLEPFSLTVSRDFKEILKKVSFFVNAYSFTRLKNKIFTKCTIIFHTATQAASLSVL